MIAAVEAAELVVAVARESACSAAGTTLEATSWGGGLGGRIRHCGATLYSSDPRVIVEGGAAESRVATHIEDRLLAAARYADTISEGACAVTVAVRGGGTRIVLRVPSDAAEPGSTSEALALEVCSAHGLVGRVEVVRRPVTPAWWRHTAAASAVRAALERAGVGRLGAGARILGVDATELGAYYRRARRPWLRRLAEMVEHAAGSGYPLALELDRAGWRARWPHEEAS